MYRHFFFDLDNTVTRSRSPVTPEMRVALRNLQEKGMDVIIVSGARVEQAQTQLEKLLCYYLGQNGNHAVDGKSGKDVWRHALTPAQKEEIMKHIRLIPRTYAVSDEHDLIEDRECQISYSLIGHHESLEKKEAFDPQSEKRKELLKRYPLNSDNVEVKIGGTTCFDYIQKGKHKGFNIAAFIEHMSWDKRECVYVGDALFPGGNDETVIGIIETVPVKNPQKTLSFLQNTLLSAR